MKKIVYSGLFLTSLVLTACGGGSSSDGGGSDGAGSAGAGSDGGGTGSVAIPPGTYSGPVTVTASGGGLSETVTDTLTVVVEEDGADIDFGDVPGTVTVNGNQITAAVPASTFNDSDVTCSGTIVVTGTVNGDTITGDISGKDIVCNGIPITVTGDYTLTRVSQSRRSLEFLPETTRSIGAIAR